MTSAATCGFGQGFQVRNIALSGQPAPGQPVGVTFSSFDAFSINASGKVGMSCTLAIAGGTPSTRQALWWDVPGSLQQVVRTGDPAPGQPGLNYTSLIAPNLSNGGTMVIGGLIAPTGGGSRSCIYTISPSSLPSAVAIGFEQVPGLAAGTLWDTFNLPNINGAGQLAFRAILGGPQAGDSHWIGTPSGLVLVARNDAPTGVLAGVNFTGLFNDYAINSAGTYTFRSSLAGTGVTTANDNAIWMRSASGVLALIARTGDQAPGLAPGVVFSSIITGPTIDSSGRIAFTTALTGPGITSLNNTAAWVYDAGTTALLAQEGTQAPGLAAGVVFDGQFAVTLGGQSALVLEVDVRGPGVVSANRTALYRRAGSGPMTLVARSGSPAPGVLPGVNFDFSTDFNVAMNASGRVMLVASLANNREGIWIEDATGALRLAVLENTPFDVNDDPNITTLKTVSSLGFPPAAGDDDGRRSAFGDRNEVAFRLTFTDGTSGAFVASLPQACDAIDFNNDTSSFDPQDIEAFLSVYSEGPCIPSSASCNDIDFNNDGSVFDPCDISSFLTVYAEGPCTPCGQ